jgi:hypothetical protein
MRRVAFTILVSGFIASAAIADGGKYTSQEGTWKLNVGETMIPSNGFKAPIDELLEVTKDDGTVLEYTVHTITQHGLVPGARFKGAYDGKQYPSGAGPTTVSYAHLSETSYKDVVMLVDGGTITEIGTIMQNGKKMKLEGKFEPKTGTAYEYLLVYDKVK